MLQSASGSLVLIDVNTAAPVVYWQGMKLPVESVSVLQKKVTIRVHEGALSLLLIDELRAANIEVKGVKK